MSSESSEAFFKLLKWKEDQSLIVNFNGHCHGIENDLSSLDYYKKHAVDAFAFSKFELKDGQIKDDLTIAMAKAIETKVPLEKPINASTCFCRCRHCGEELKFASDGTKIWTENRCPYPEGHPAFEFEINVPSGLFVVGNDFRKAFPVAGDFEIDTIVGLKATSDAYAKIGLAHAFVGNTCPSVYRSNDKTFAIGTCGSKGRHPVKRSRRVAGICTDLWWYSIADFNEYCLRNNIEDKEKFREEGGRYVEFVKCRPGVYRFKHQYHLQKDDYKTSQVYTYVDWVREPDPVTDLQAEYKNKNYTAGQIVAHYQKRWGYSIERAIDHLFFTNGSGTEIHPNGWLIPSSAIVDEDLPDIEIPVLDKQHYWYPFSDFSMICHVAGCSASHFKAFHGQKTPYLNESFTAVAFNALRCILLYGIDERQKKDWGEQMTKAASKAFKGLAKLYPDRVPENCKELLKTIKEKNHVGSSDS